jgi:Mn-dependent DtxR family transcriptional regulator
MIQMIKDNRMFLDLPEDWKKIIRILKDGPASREEIVKRSGVDEKKATKIIKAMRDLAMVDKGPDWVVTLRDKK